MEIVEPAVLTVRPLVPTKLEVAGAEILTTEPFVPESVRLIPEYPMVEPEAVVLPAVLAPSRLIQLFSAAAPGAATEAVTIPPALVPKVTLLALEKLRVLKVKLPALFEAARPTSAVKTVEFPAAPKPNEILLELEKFTVLVEIVAPPAAIPLIASPPPAATEAVTIPPAEVPNVTLFAFEKFSVWNVKLPFDALAA
jgi:hypothetical protein